ncbi:hypothetical protein [Paraburkholderia sp. J10-1]|uniref:hypothetical protein n=1 Tax=Paraburkholderia sp. J10-1 TaxID=2805430 RepID=UPI002AB7502E|nr:hypothetical protein [Paraburkholderia sp. J10-1]
MQNQEKWRSHKGISGEYRGGNRHRSFKSQHIEIAEKSFKLLRSIKKLISIK